MGAGRPEQAGPRIAFIDNLQIAFPCRFQIPECSPEVADDYRDHHRVLPERTQDIMYRSWALGRDEFYIAIAEPDGGTSDVAEHVSGGRLWPGRHLGKAVASARRRRERLRPQVSLSHPQRAIWVLGRICRLLISLGDRLIVLDQEGRGSWDDSGINCSRTPAVPTLIGVS